MQTIAAERVADLHNALEAARSSLQQTLARGESEKSRLQRELQESQRFFKELCAKSKTEIEDIEKQLKAEVRCFTFTHLFAPTDGYIQDREGQR
jgi:multidrug resistance efflux pump